MNASKCLASRSCFYNIYLYFFLNAVLALILLCTVRHLCHRTCDVTRVESPLGDILAVLAAQQICSVSCFWGLILPLKNRPKKLFFFLFFVNCIFCIYSFNFLKKHSLHRHFKAFHWLRNNESFSRQRGSPLCFAAASPAKSDFMLLRDNLFNYCRADLQSHLPDDYLIDSFDT